jgi:hypothetical protein
MAIWQSRIAKKLLVIWLCRIAQRSLAILRQPIAKHMLTIFGDILSLKQKRLLATNALQRDFQCTHAIYGIYCMSHDSFLRALLQGNSADLPHYNASQRDLQPV